MGGHRWRGPGPPRRRLVGRRRARPSHDLAAGRAAAGSSGALRYTQELVTHAWDLATALGRADELDPALAAPMAQAARRFIPRDGREDWPFGEVVDVADDAGPYERLVGWLGRDPSWRPPA